MKLRIVSWNVNGIRAAIRNGGWNWIKTVQPDILLLQEVKAFPGQVSEEYASPAGYVSFWQPAEKRGYSGVAAFSRQTPVRVYLLGNRDFDCEGRLQALEYPGFTLINTYFPNSQEKGRRLQYKLDFCSSILGFCEGLRREGKNVILCGDYNIAHKAIDLANPDSNEKNPGFLPEEREWMDRFLSSGYSDTFRMFHPEPGHYTWWSYRFRAREKDIGWRIDYHCVNSEFAPNIVSCRIEKDVMGSDHCPVTLEIEI